MKTPLTYGFGNVPTGRLTGTGSINGQGSRVVLTCDPNISRGDRWPENDVLTQRTVSWSAHPNRGTKRRHLFKFALKDDRPLPSLAG